MTEPSDSAEQWRPCATLATLHARARLLARVRSFFAEREVLEVETPLLSQAGSTDPALHSFSCTYIGPGEPRGAARWLPTSPEMHMKRLVAAGSGPIYQVCKAFRNGERGRLHNPEFSLLEWYRPGYDHHRLMDEVEELVRMLFAPDQPLPAAARMSYGEAFARYVGIDAHGASVPELRARAATLGIEAPPGLRERDGWLDLLLTHLVEPGLAEYELCFVYDYPASQAALARIRSGQPDVAERFELYLRGTELANGFHELTDHREQEQRFERDLAHRVPGEATPPADARMLAALRHGLPGCAGVALGLDRLLLALLRLPTLDQTLAFPWERA